MTYHVDLTVEEEDDGFHFIARGEDATVFIDKGPYPTQAEAIEVGEAMIALCDKLSATTQ